MCQRKLTLILSTTNKRTRNSLEDQWNKWGVELVSPIQASAATDKAIEGVLVCDEQAGGDALLLPLLERHAAASASDGKQRPFLVLVVGSNRAIPAGMADELQRKYAAHPVEVVRFFLMPNGTRAIIGGEADGYWVSRLRRLVAGKGIISLICTRAEVDEIATQLVNYLRLKQRFFLQLARRCEARPMRLEVIAQALGMDERVGQGWLYQDEQGSAPMKEIERWLQNKIKAAVMQFRPLRAVICGYREQIDSLSAWLVQQDSRIETCAYVVDHAEKTNEADAKAVSCDTFSCLLQGAELLIIAAANSVLQELHMEQLTQQMRQPTVIDALCLFPQDEAEKFAITYITYGQNTNVRNENYTGRK